MAEILWFLHETIKSVMKHFLNFIIGTGTLFVNITDILDVRVFNLLYCYIPYKAQKCRHSNRVTILC